MELLDLAKAVGVLTGTEYVIATIFYFRRRARSRATLALSLLLVGAMAVHGFFLARAENTPGFEVTLSLVFFAISNGLFWSALFAHGGSRPSAVFGETAPQALVVSAPYNVVRHPLYLAYVTGFLGSACIGSHWVPFLLTAVLFACYDRAARNEERLLLHDAGPFAREYTEYLQRSWRWLPFVW